MESNSQRTKVKVRNPKTLKNSIQKKFKSKYWKAKVFVTLIISFVILIIGFFILSMPFPEMPKTANTNSYGPSRQ
jgi:hypothetical protein